MTNQEILEKAIHKALHNGWRELSDPWRLFDTAEHIGEGLWKFWCSGTWYQTTIEPIIFNHDFAKALWGEEPKEYRISYKVTSDPSKTNTLEPSVSSKPSLYEWQYHLQNMVISEDPIKYLGDNIDF